MVRAAGVALALALALCGARAAWADGACSCDTDGDKIVGIPDFALFLAHFGTPCEATGAPCGDCTGDDSIGLPDFFPLLEQFASHCPKGDLNVPDDRLLTPEGASRWPAPPEPADTTGWQVIPVTGCDLEDTATDDAACVDAAMAAATASTDPTVVFFPSGTYNFINDHTVRVSRSNLVLRCEDPATTVLEFAALNVASCVSADGYNTQTHVCFGGGGDSAPVTWTGGFQAGDRVLQVASTAGFAAGDWVIASMGETGAMDACLDAPLLPGLWHPDNFDHVARLTAVNPANGTLTIDRPLRMDYTIPDCGPRKLRRIAAIENVGIENCKIDNVDNTKMVYRTGISFERVARAWATNVEMDNYHNVFINSQGSRDVLVAHSRFKNLFAAGPGSTQGIHWAHTTDGYTIDNIFENVRVASECEQGAEGIVYAYNYMVPGYADRERSFFLHGKYCREALVEGNDSDAAIQADTFWGRNGPRNTFYRNRHRDNPSGNNAHAFYFSFHGWKDDGVEAGDRFTVLANSGNWFMNGPYFPTPPTNSDTVHDYDLIVPDLWLERNLATSNINLVEPRPETSCGTSAGPGDCLAGGPGFVGDNHEGSAVPTNWKNFQLPPSLFLDGAPAWWCQEACRFDEAGIGAIGDDMSGALCKLPAQIRHEGGTCTPLVP